jgi:hypothetical protein
VAVVSGCGALVLVGSAIAPVTVPAREGIRGMADVGIAVCVGVGGALVVFGSGGAFGVYGGGGVGFITTSGGIPSLRFFSDVILTIDRPVEVAAEREVGDLGDVSRIPAGISPTTDCSTFWRNAGAAPTGEHLVGEFGCEVGDCGAPKLR